MRVNHMSMKGFWKFYEILGEDIMHWFMREPVKGDFRNTLKAWNSDCKDYEILKLNDYYVHGECIHYYAYTNNTKPNSKHNRINNSQYNSFREAADACEEHQHKWFLEVL